MIMNNEFDQVFKLMQNSFPKSEYRTYENQKKLIQKKEYNLITKKDENNNVIAFISIWNLEGFNFVEHLAVSPACRGMGMGTKIMEEIIQASKNKNIILEIEPPCDEITDKRLRFYEKLGFKLNDYEYYQPSMQKNQKQLKLNLMSYPNPLNEDEFEKIKNCLYEKVYNL